MKNTKMKAIGKEFSQKSLPYNLCKVSCGQPFIWRGLNQLLLFFTIALAGLMSGLFSLTAVRILFIANDEFSLRSMLMLLLTFLIVPLIWIQNGISRGFNPSILSSCRATLAIIFVSALITGKPIEFITFFALVGPFSVSCIQIAFLSCVFSLFLTDAIFQRMSVLGKRIIVITFILISIAWPFCVLRSATEGSLLSSNYYFPAKLISGTVTGSYIALASLTAQQARGQVEKSFRFLKSWVITLVTYKGTSFYNLDLSGVDFSGANLANSDFRALKFYRTVLRGTTGLSFSRVDNRYLDLENLKVQELLTKGKHYDKNFKSIKLKGAYLSSIDLREVDFTDANLEGADLSKTDLRQSYLDRVQATGATFQAADLRDSHLVEANLTESNFRDTDLRNGIFVRTQVSRTDFTGADLTGICIEDWSVSNQTNFTNVRCDYIYQTYKNGKPCDRYPANRNFDSDEFAALHTTPEDIITLIFKGNFDYAALSLSLYKLQTEAPDLDIELRGIERRQNLWVVKVKSDNAAINENLVEERLDSVYSKIPNKDVVATTIKNSIYRDYEDTKRRLTESEQLVRKLAGLSGDQAEALKVLTNKSLGNNFFISGSNITNLAGSGTIEYREAAECVRNLVTQPSESASTLQRLFALFNDRNIATTADVQQDLIQQVLLAEAENDLQFKQLLLQDGEQMIKTLPNEALSAAVKYVMSQLRA